MMSPTGPTTGRRVANFLSAGTVRDGVQNIVQRSRFMASGTPLPQVTQCTICRFRSRSFTSSRAEGSIPLSAARLRGGQKRSGAGDGRANWLPPAVVAAATAAGTSELWGDDGHALSQAQCGVVRVSGPGGLFEGAVGTSMGRLPNPATITDVYNFDAAVEPVGRGHRSTVSIATHRLTGKAVAVKQISRKVSNKSEVMSEVRMLKLAGVHPNVVSLQDFFEDKEAFYIVMDLVKGGELYDRLADKGRYSEGQAARIMAEVMEAVSFLHATGIIHFDLKPENIMLASCGDDFVPEVKLADFGSAFWQHCEMAGTRDFTTAYSAPEVLARGEVDEKVDVWALGVVMWVLLSGRHPFDTSIGLGEEEVARRVRDEEPDLHCKGMRHVSPEGKDLVRRLLAKDPRKRPSVRQALSHPWFRAVIGRRVDMYHATFQPRSRSCSGSNSQGMGPSLKPQAFSQSRSTSVSGAFAVGGGGVHTTSTKDNEKRG